MRAQPIQIKANTIAVECDEGRRAVVVVVYAGAAIRLFIAEDDVVSSLTKAAKLLPRFQLVVSPEEPLGGENFVQKVREAAEEFWLQSSERGEE